MAQALVKRHPNRQKVRRAVLFAAFLLFPVTLNFLSPYVIIDGAFQGILAGSAIVFGLLFLSALFVGRLWCAYLCPAGGIGEACFMVNNKPVKGGRRDWIKWGIWIPWMALIAYGIISAGGYRKVDFLHLTETGISVDEPMKYFIYYIVVLTIFGLAVAFGRRAFCHYGCWMAPFMIIGRKVRNALNTPALRLQVQPDQCIQCHRCDNACPMSLGVQAMVATGSMENSECILCGSCVDACPRQVIRYSFSRGK
ncbi:MAG: 4Fe-4S binding protein [Anaerolineae bacterium]|nr:4Fe-4S binding protein [Anaerolineae bacterium]